ncbi:type III secretion protein [Burkholderia stagnalis]|uniref:flagellar biosynthetic protein FliR n=1 Tax=Burkholderia stagnalis TaxID=1503054 RepID=UPI000F5A25B4|nr:flagellar biosynthetic protein FliR [Burkholderia stagnalis]RQQ07102.1 type III secretion protein [Burkholderia stagnalis]RQQ94143.1 type III secretion protein [Burkholderia stagnalis]RQX85878.1 type III secretion protein [Burkholderia stagnalis]RQY75925.1 type III secretion protein [Burkholderia stagnalis]
MAANPNLGWAAATLLLSLRVGPIFTAAPPFSQMAIPMRIKMAMTLTLSACLATTVVYTGPVDAALITAAAWECLLGFAIAFAFQAAFAALSFAGRVLDVQAGYGLAMVIDPGSRSQAPLLGTIVTMAAGIIFFASNGHLELLRLLFDLTRLFPPANARIMGDVASFASYFGSLTSIALAATAAVMLPLFLTDLAIAFLARALPQMNALMLGFQIKVFVTLIAMALATGALAPVVLRLVHSALNFVPATFKRYG